jgi:hypothetical protein
MGRGEGRRGGGGGLTGGQGGGREEPRPRERSISKKSAPGLIITKK